MLTPPCDGAVSSLCTLLVSYYQLNQSSTPATT